MEKSVAKKWIIILFVQLFFALIMFPGCVRKEQTIMFYDRESVKEQALQWGNDIQFDGERVLLTPGVYQVRVHTNASQEDIMYFEMKCDMDTHKALRGNVVVLFEGDDYEDFNVYAVGKVPSAYLHCFFGGASAESLVSLEICKTNLGNRIILFSYIVVVGIVDFLVLLSVNIRTGKMTRKQQLILGILFIGVVLAYLPYASDHFYLGTDSNFHIERIAHLKESLVQGGGFPVRVQSTWLSDHGYAVSLFYGDIFLYIPALLMVIGFPAMTAYKLFVLMIMIATAGVAYFSFEKCVRNEYASLFGSMVYLLNIYRISNIYIRGGIGEGLAMIFLPLVLCGLFNLYMNDTGDVDYTLYKWYVVAGMTGVLQSHLLTTALVIVCIAVFCMICLKKTLRKVTFIELVKATVITLLINAWFLFPFVYMMNADVYYLGNIPQPEIQPRGLNVWQLLDGMNETVHIGIGAMILLVVYLLKGIIGIGKNKRCDLLVGFLVMTVGLSTCYFPWDALKEVPCIGSFASSIQYPTRWMALASVFAAMFASCFVECLLEERRAVANMTVIVVALITVATSVYQIGRVFDEMEPTYLYSVENMGNSAVGSGEYLPLDAPLREIVAHRPLAEEGLKWSDYEKKGTDVTIFLENAEDRERYIEIPLLGYKGYQISCQENVLEFKNIPYISEERGAHGDLKIIVPTGFCGKIQVNYRGGVVFRVAEIVSILSTLVLIWMRFCWGKLKYKKLNAN